MSKDKQKIISLMNELTEILKQREYQGVNIAHAANEVARNLTDVIKDISETQTPEKTLIRKVKSAAQTLLKHLEVTIDHPTKSIRDDQRKRLSNLQSILEKAIEKLNFVLNPVPPHPTEKNETFTPGRGEHKPYRVKTADKKAKSSLRYSSKQGRHKTSG